MGYLVRKTFLGRYIVSYVCAHCSSTLESPLEEAGTSQPCPNCRCLFITPGIKELEESRALALRKDENKVREKEDKASRERAKPQRVEARPVRIDRPPQLVWYGFMRCHDCGYDWKARRRTPPRRCGNCSSRNIEVVRTPKRSFSWLTEDMGCLVVLTVILAVGAGVVALLAL